MRLVSSVSGWGSLVAAAMRSQCPDRSRHSVGQRNRHHLYGLAGKHTVEPVRCLTCLSLSTPPSRADPGHSTEVKQSAQIPITGLRDPSEPFSTAGVGAWRQAEPCCVVACSAKGRDIRRGGGERAAGERSYSGIVAISSSHCISLIRMVTSSIRACVSRN